MRSGHKSRDLSNQQYVTFNALKYAGENFQVLEQLTLRKGYAGALKSWLVWQAVNLFPVVTQPVTHRIAMVLLNQ